MRRPEVGPGPSARDEAPAAGPTTAGRASTGSAPPTAGWGRFVPDALYAVLALAVPVAVIASLVVSARRGRVVTNEIFSYTDDAFYYFEIAARWADGQGSTFDGLQSTNGYQPLWFWVNAAVFTVASRPAAVVAIVGITALLWVTTVALARSTAHHLGSPWSGVAAVAVVGGLTYRTWFAGMEFALVVTTVTAVIWWALRTAVLTSPHPRPRDALVLGLLLAVAVFARLDAAALVAVLGVVLLLLPRPAPWTSRWKAFALATGPVVVALATYAALGLLWFGSAVPISGRAKQLGPFSPHPGYVLQYLLLSFGGRVGYLGVVTLLITATVLLLQWRRRPMAPRRAAVFVLLVALIVTQGLALCYYLIASSWGFETWYFGLVPATLLLASTALGGTVGVLPRRRSVPRGVVAVAAVVVVLGVTLDVAQGSRPRPSTERPIAATVAAADWVNRSLPPEVRLAMGDWGGAFGFAAERSVVQTEGLVGSVEYLHALEQGRAGRFLADAGVSYFVKVGDDRETGAGPGCSVVREPVYGDGPTFGVRVCDADLVHLTPGPAPEGDVRIWRVTPDSFVDG